MAEQTHFLETVRTEEWRHNLLEKVSRVTGFDVLVDLSCHAVAAVNVPDIPTVNRQARQIVQSYGKEELATARQYYNNEHLLEYWKYYNSELEKVIATHSLDPAFPLFGIEVNLRGLTYRAHPIPLGNFLESGSGGFSPLDRLRSQLAPMLMAQRRIFKTLYVLFLNLNRKAHSETWDYYRIHYFLDNNLYEIGNGRYYRSPFDFVFFNTNMLELRLFLEHQLQAGATLSVADVGDFLRRQREYYLHLALSVTSEENEIHNHRRDLCWYDAAAGVVKDGVSDELREYYRRNVVEPYGLVKLTGCPFARSKGLKKNSLLEVFEYSDGLMLHLLSQSEEFQRAFGSRGAGISGQ